MVKRKKTIVINNTEKKVTITNSEGGKQTVKKGEDLISDYYVGMKEEADDGTEGDTTGTSPCYFNGKVLSYTYYVLKYNVSGGLTT